MSQPLGEVEGVVTGDAELVARVRAGSTAQYPELVIRHGPAAVRLATEDPSGADPDVLVGEAFDKVLGVLQNGGGPDIAFRPYLLTVVRRLHTTDDPTPFEPGAAYADHAAGRAFASLPERWQLVLWHLDVEGEDSAEIAPLLAIPADSIPDLADQARTGLRQALLDLDLDPDRDLRDVLGPVVLGAAAAAYLSTPVAGTSHSGRESRARAAVPRRVGAAAVGGLLAVATVVAVVASGLGSGQPEHNAPSDGQRADGPSRSIPKRVAADPVASANGVPTASPTAAATLAGVSLGTPAAAAASGSPAPSPGNDPTSRKAPAATADVAVAARSTTNLPRSYDVQNTLRGVPARRTTTLVVQGSPGMRLSPEGMSCTGGGSARLQCTVGSGTTQGSFSVLDLGMGSARVSLTIAPVTGFADPSPGNNATTLTFS